MKGNILKENNLLFDDEIVSLHLKEKIPLSSSQKSIWFMDQMFPNSSIYNIPVFFQVNGKLDITILKSAIYKLITMNEIFRTNFHIHNNEVKQRVNESYKPDFKVFEFKKLNKEEIEKKTQDTINQEINRPFDLEKDQLFRTVILNKAEDDNVVLFVFHHIIADGWSIDLFLEDLSSLYNKYLNNQKLDFSVGNIQYSDYAIWQQNWLRNDLDKVSELLNFWEGNLRGVPNSLQLPLDYKRPVKPSYIGETKSIKLSKEIKDNLNQFNKSNSLSMYMTCLAVFSILIHRYTDEDDILIGTPSANRNKLETEKMYGHFVNTLVIRSRYEGRYDFHQYLKQIKDTVFSCFENQDLPFEKLVEKLKPERIINNNPLFQVAFSYQNKEAKKLDLQGVVIEKINENSETSKVDLYMVIEEDNDELSITVEYNKEIYKDSSIIRMLKHYQEIIKNILDNPRLKLEDIPLIDKEEEAIILDGFNDKSEYYDKTIFVHQLIEEQVLKNPDQVACVFGEKTLTYKELNERANALAHDLIKIGVTKEKIVGICINRSLDMVVALLGVLKAGGAYLPIDPFQPKDRNEIIISDAKPIAILSKGNLIDTFINSNIPILDMDNTILDNPNIENPGIELSPENLAYVIYTSGTTGKPKGVMVNHLGLMNLASTEMKNYNITSDSRILHVASFAFDSALYGILLALTQGASLYIASLDKLSSNTDIIEMINEWGITYTNLTPSILRTFNPDDVPTLKTVISYGEELTRDLVKKWSAKNRKIYNGYGPTETTVGATIFECSDESDKDPSIGKPFNNYSIYILDKKLKPVPIGIPGEIYIGGDGIARGYLNAIELTAERFLPNPFSHVNGDRMYRTGDIGKFRENGEIEHLGRIDSQVKIRGFRIELKDIEQTILEHQGIGGVIVDVIDDNSRKKIVAYLVTKDGISIHPGKIISFLKGKLPEYMIPSFFIEIDSIPLTPGGKLDKKLLPDVKYSRNQNELPYLDPCSETEKLIHSVWKKILKIDEISINDNFFEIGGHSLLVAQLTFMLREKYDLKIPMTKLFEHPTICEMGKVIDTLKNPEVNSTTSITKNELLKDVHLQSDIKPKYPFELKKMKNKKILLTGSTGFVGAYLLDNLLKNTNAEIYCLIRAQNEKEAEDKLIINMKYHNLWDENSKTRIKLVIGDLSESLLGLEQNLFNELCEEIDVIYHNGALVNLTYPYIVTKAPNVLGTIEIIKLACKVKTKPIHFTSTLSVFSDNDKRVSENDISMNGHDINTGYSQSKWVAEQILNIARDRGVPVNIYRLGRVFGSSDTGICQPDDFLWKFIKSCITLSKIPKMNEYFNISPVDYVAKSILSLSKDNNNYMHNFHIISEEEVSFKTIALALKKVGYDLDEIDYESWLTEFEIYNSKNREKGELSPISLLLQNDSNEEKNTSLIIDGDTTRRKLKEYGIFFPPINEQILIKTIKHFIKVGHFKDTKSK